MDIRATGIGQVDIFCYSPLQIIRVTDNLKSSTEPSMSRSLPALPPQSGCRVCGLPGFKLCADCARVVGSNQQLDWVCTVCGKATNQYTAVKANLHRACEALPTVTFNQTGMVEYCDRENASRQARLFGGK